MRLDPEHVEKLKRTIHRAPEGGAEIILLDHKFMAGALVRLPLWERGLVVEAVLRAAKAKHPSKAQRALLALFLTNDPKAHGGDDVSA